MNRSDQEEQRRRAWQDGIGRLDQLLKDYPDTAYLAEALYERLGVAKPRPHQQGAGRVPASSEEEQGRTGRAGRCS